MQNSIIKQRWKVITSYAKFSARKTNILTLLGNIFHLGVLDCLHSACSK